MVLLPFKSGCGIEHCGRILTVQMKNCASISGVDVESDRDFIVYGPVIGLTAECIDLRKAKRILDQKRHEAMERNVVADLAFFGGRMVTGFPRLAFTISKRVILQKIRVR